MKLRQQIAKKLSAERKAQRLTMQQIAEKIGTHKETICVWEKGLLNITANTIERLFKALGKKVKLIVMDSNKS